MTTHPDHPIKNQRGFILTAVYLVISLISIFSIAYFSRSTVFVQANERNVNQMVAFNMAESALDYTFKQLDADDSYTGSGYVSMNTNFMNGGFSSTVTQDTSNPNVRIIQANGFAPSNDNTARNYQTATIIAYVQSQTSSPFNFAVFATDSIMMSGNAKTDAYDSRDGSYGGSNLTYEGDIGTNASSAKMVQLSGNVKIQGNAQVGPTETPDTVITTSGNAKVTGTVSASSTITTFDAASTTVSSSGALNLSGNTSYYLASGTYHYTSINITGNAKLIPTGAVSIYVDGTIKIAGNGIATSADDPTNLSLYATGDSNVQFTGNANFYGSLYAPNSKVAISGNGNFYGAIVSKYYQNSGNGQTHFDKALKDSGGSGSGPMTITAWQEQNSLAWGTGS